MQKFLNTLWEFTEGKEGIDNFIQKALKVCKVFKVKPLKTPKLDAPSKKTAYNLFCKDIQKTKKELLGVSVSKASAITSREWKKVKANENKMEKYKDLYGEEKQRHEEALQRYQKDYMDKMEIISLHKRCNKKAKKVSQPKKASPKSDEPKKVSGPIDDPIEEEQNPKKAGGKNTTTKTGKKVKKASQAKKAPNTPEFVDTGLDDTDQEQERVVNKPQIVPKAPEFVDTGTDNEQNDNPKKQQKPLSTQTKNKGPR